MEYLNKTWYQYRNTNYWVTKCGKVLSYRNNKKRLLKFDTNKDGYQIIGVFINGKQTKTKIHRIVAEIFIPNPDNKPQVNHINGIKTDNRVENLEWCTANYNINHAVETGLRKNKGIFNNMSKLTEAQVLEIRMKFKPRIYTRIMLAIEYNISPATIKNIVTRRNWKHI